MAFDHGGENMKRWLLGLFCLLLSGAALAAGPDAVRKRVQASMLVRGSITVAPDGSVAGYVIDQPEKLPLQVRELIGKSIPRWRFDALEVAGKPATMKSDMSFRVVAKPIDKSDYSIGIAGATFTPEKNTTDKVVTDSPTYKNNPPPPYPQDAYEAGATATVYVLAQIDRQGRVENDLAQQVDLGFVDSDFAMRGWRRMFALAASRAVKHWTFNMPTTGRDAMRTYWYGRIPIVFQIPGEHSVTYGHWSAYVPGPVETAAWLTQLPHLQSNDRLLVGNIDATPPGGSFSLDGNGLHLISKLDGT